MADSKYLDFKPRRTPAGAQHGLVSANIVYELKLYLAQHELGQCFGAGTGFITSTSPARVVSLDAAVVRNDRIKEGSIGADVFSGAPDLAVIVIAPNDKFDEIESDTHDLMAAGTGHVWIMRPRVRMITVHRSLNDLQIMGESEFLTAEDILPGFRVPVARVFDGK
jgi:Uma2 family endonuclease